MKDNSCKICHFGDVVENEKIPHGEKMITFKIRFWANDLPGEKTAWNSGAITAVTNRSRGIRGTDPVFFQSIDELTVKMKEMLKKHGVILVEEDSKTKKKIIVDLE